MTEPVTGKDAPKGKTSRFPRGALLICALAVVAIGPWLFPWQSVFGSAAPADDPSSMIKQATGQASGKQPSATASATRQGPTDETVRKLAKQVASIPGFDVPVSAKEVAGVSTTPGPYQKLGRLRIPSVGLDTQYGEGVFDKTLAKGPGHWPGTAMPGHEGNSVISGHRNTNTQPFKELDRLPPGTAIIVSYGNESPVTFKVTGTKIIPQAEYKDYVLRQPKAGVREITLFACHPEGNPIYRIVVQGVASTN